MFSVREVAGLGLGFRGIGSGTMRPWLGIP